jgi:hypothetical protein
MAYDYKTEYENVLKKRQEAQAVANAAVDKSFEASKLAAEQQLPQLEEAAKQNRRQLQANYNQQLSTMPAQMARLGLYGTGAAESSNVAMRNNYNSNLANVDYSLTNAKNDIANTIAGYKAQAEANKANIAAQYAAELPALYQQYAQAIASQRASQRGSTPSESTPSGSARATNAVEKALKTINAQYDGLLYKVPDKEKYPSLYALYEEKGVKVPSASAAKLIGMTSKLAQIPNR